MKKYANSTLMMMTKAELIEMIRCLEHNCEGLQEQNDRQFKLLNSMVDVVRCKDCIHWKPCEDPQWAMAHYCRYAGWLVGENGYCVYGERKDKDD